MSKENNMQTTTAPAEQNITQKPRTNGSFFERRYRLYDKIKLSVKALDVIIAVAVVMLLVVFILGVYKR